MNIPLVDDVVVSQAAGEYFQNDQYSNPNGLDFTAFVSCYNEANIILTSLLAVKEAINRTNLSFEIIIIDDCSSDGSRKKIEAFIEQNSDINIVARFNLKNRGLAQNYIDAAFLGSGKYIKLFCGDNTEPVDSIVKLLNCIGKADMLIPFYSDVPGKPKFRLILSSTFTNLVNLVSGHRIKYYNGLQVHTRNNILRWHPNTRGFGFQADILCMLLDQGFTYREIQIEAQEINQSGALTPKNFLSVAHTLLDIFIRRISRLIYE